MMCNRLVLLGCLLLVSFLVGCGSDSGSQTPARSAPPPPPTKAGEGALAPPPLEAPP